MTFIEQFDQLDASAQSSNASAFLTYFHVLRNRVLDRSFLKTASKIMLLDRQVDRRQDLECREDLDRSHCPARTMNPTH